MTAKPNISHLVREYVRDNGPVSMPGMADALSITDPKERMQLTRAATQMAKAGILLADKTKWPVVYTMGREAEDRKVHPPEVYDARRRERHRLLMRKKAEIAKANRPPKPPKPPKKAAPAKVVVRLTAPVPPKPVVQVETVEQWMLRTGQKPEKLHSFLSSRDGHGS